MVENVLQVLIAIGTVFFFWRIEVTIMAAVLASALGLTLLFSYWQWRRTLVRFTDSDVIVERDTLFKLKKVLPYSKIASVNLTQGVVNRLFGTSKLLININSGHNAVAPEASLTFKRELAEGLRRDISLHLYDRGLSLEIEKGGEQVISFSTMDVVLHSLFSVSTFQTLLGALFLANSVFELYSSAATEMGSLGSALTSLGMFFLVQIVPSVAQLFRYYNFKVQRKGDIIHLQHGLLRTYKSSFSVTKINAVRVQSTLVSRLLHRSCIEAEVVGIATGDGNGSSRPVICLLKDDGEVRKAMEELVPEFVYEREPRRQPEGAWKVLGIQTVIASLLLAAVMAYPSYVAYQEISSQPGAMGLLAYAPPAVTALVVLTALYAARASYRVREMDTGEGLFTFVSGILDRQTVTMSYDKVQMVRITQGPLARRFGVSRGTVHMLSSMGSRSVSSGLFPPPQLERISEIVMDRMTTGKYDHRVNGT